MKIFYLPDLGEGLAEAEIQKWYIKVGEAVKVDQPLVALETAKALVDVPSPFTGKIAKLFGEVNAIIKTGAPLIGFEVEEGDLTPTQKNTVVGALEESNKNWQEEESESSLQPVKAFTSVKILPRARILAEEMQIDLNLIIPSGPNHLITLKDVKDYLAQQSITPPSLATSFQGGEKLHGVRRTMAQAMMKSHHDIVPVTLMEDANISHIDADLTVKILLAMVAGIQKEPAVNAWFDGQSLQRKICSDINIGLALDHSQGLFVPVLMQVAQKNPQQLRSLINQFKEKVKTRDFNPQELQGASITLSNFGTLAGRYATPIIIPPSIAILGCGQSRVLPYV